MPIIIVWNQENIITMVGMAVTFIVVLFVFMAETRKYQRYRSFLRREALKFNGTVMSADPFSIPCMYFTYKDIDINVYVTPMRSGRVYRQPPILHLQAVFPYQTNYWFCVCPKDARSKQVSDLCQNSKTFSEKFTGEYYLKSNDKDFVQSALTQEIRQGVIRLLAEKPVFFYEKNIFQLSVPYPVISDKIFEAVLEPSKMLISRLNEIGQYQ